MCIISNLQHAARIQHARRFNFKKGFKSRVTSNASSTDEGLRVNRNVLPKYTGQIKKRRLLSTSSNRTHIQLSLLKLSAFWVRLLCFQFGQIVLRSARWHAKGRTWEYGAGKYRSPIFITWHAHFRKKICWRDKILVSIRAPRDQNKITSMSNLVCCSCKLPPI